MADKTDNASEIRRKAQRNGEEDPVIIAQRFLNIFRQLHIFSDERREAFNRMLLEQPADIRGMFHNLPGGGLLQEYVDDLAEKAGLETASSTLNKLPDMADDEVSKAKILATALAEAQIQANAKIQQAAPVVSTAQPAATTTSAPVQTIIRETAGPTKIELGANFAQELAQAVAVSLKNNGRESQPDFSNMMQTLEQTQLEIVKTLQSEKEGHREETLNLAKMLTETQAQMAKLINAPRESAAVEKETAAPAMSQGPSEESLELFRVMSETQSQMAQTLARLSEIPQTVYSQTADVPAPTAPVAPSATSAEPQIIQVTAPKDEETTKILRTMIESQNKLGERMLKLESENKKDNSAELAQLFASSQQQFAKALAMISENHKNDAVQIAEVINSSQKELVKALVQNNTLNQNTSNAGATSNNANNIQINSVDYSAQLNLIADKLANISGLNTASLEKSMTTLVKSQSELYREVASAQTKELSAIITVALKESQQISTQNLIKAIEAMPKAQVVERVVQAPIYQPAPVYAEPDVAREEPEAVEEISLQWGNNEEPLNIFAESAESDDSPKPVREPFSFGEIPNAEEGVSFAEFGSPIENIEAPTFEADAAAVIENSVQKKKKKKKKKKKSDADNRNESLEENTETAIVNLEVSESSTVEMPNEALSSEESLTDNPTEAFMAEESEPVTANFESLDEPLPNEFDKFQTDDEALAQQLDNMDFLNLTDDVAEESPQWEEDIGLLTEEDADFVSAEEAIPPVPEADVNDVNDWGFGSFEETSPVDAVKGETTPSGWEYDAEDETVSEIDDTVANEEWEWEYEEVPLEAETENSEASQESSDDSAEEWEWEYEEVPVEEESDEALAPAPGNVRFQQENLQPIGSQNPICSGDLYFQDEVYREAALPNQSSFIVGEFRAAVKDSAEEENNSDPYQNNTSKD